MTRHAIAAVLGLAAAPALAHPGHLAEVSGHSHWLAAGAMLAAAALAAWLAKSRGRAAEAEDEAEDSQADAQPEASGADQRA
ncbi:DUF6732 family protein [Oceanicella actignis]|uniref:HupE / UreJ protein n=1 Tax=Oceanicella actignis TaxID=1189325 RepID=A0A1M7THR2_9RHOB|nr:DUF6732 family protein [Oceanicella actignis]TYO88443.1 hypothetical protein LY05_02103 [Oceanicella actignis]SET58551.1 hypothetical protein SAMN04488119_10625 [Oceanicella actignis]SHN70267.1 hypothetical protein SAMN05216200_106178 [Oceanicella actignis]